jgi:hypothetical protein
VKTIKVIKNPIWAESVLADPDAKPGEYVRADVARGLLEALERIATAPDSIDEACKAGGIARAAIADAQEGTDG